VLKEADQQKTRKTLSRTHTFTEAAVTIKQTPRNTCPHMAVSQPQFI